MKRFGSASVGDAFAAMPAGARKTLMTMRGLVFEAAESNEAVGRVEETLKWGQPSYLTPETGSGSTVRLGLAKGGVPAVFFHCQSGLVGEFRELYGERLSFEGDRAILLRGKVDADAVRHCMALALTHHARRKAKCRA